LHHPRNALRQSPFKKTGRTRKKEKEKKKNRFILGRRFSGLPPPRRRTRQKRKKNIIEICGGKVPLPKPVWSFDAAGLLKILRALKFGQAQGMKEGNRRKKKMRPLKTVTCTLPKSIHFLRQAPSHNIRRRERGGEKKRKGPAPCAADLHGATDVPGAVDDQAYYPKVGGDREKKKKKKKKGKEKEREAFRWPNRV